MTSFALTWDYRCPFARNMHEHLVTALEAGADWDVRFSPFSLGQAHVADGEPPVGGRPEPDSGLTPRRAGIAARDHPPPPSRPVHRALSPARHDQGLDLRDADKLTTLVADLGV